MRARDLLVAGFAVAALLATPTVALAQDPPEPAEDPTVTVGLFGTNIVLGISVDSTGHLTQVDFDGSGVPDGEDPVEATATKVSPHMVRFVVDDDGTRLEVRSTRNRIDTRLKTTGLDALVGDHSWEGQLFDGDEPTRVTFTIVNAAGTPAIDNVEVEPVEGLEVTETTEVEDEDGEVESKVRLVITRTSDGATARVVIQVEVETDDEGHEHAKLKITARSDALSPEQGPGSGEDPAVTGSEIAEERGRHCDDSDDQSDDDCDDHSDDQSDDDDSDDEDCDDDCDDDRRSDRAHDHDDDDHEHHDHEADDRGEDDHDHPHHDHDDDHDHPDHDDDQPPNE